jgi:release factor glutamine methyltransferase
MTSLLQQIITSTSVLSKTLTDTPRLDGEVLLSHVLQCDRVDLIKRSQETLSAEDQRTFLTLLERRRKGEPIAYLVGECEFWSLPLRITSAVLIPRPETELLVEWVLSRYGGDKTLMLADLGTGSGAIALALASERPSWKITGTDISDEAISLARDNAKSLGIDSVTFQQGNWGEHLSPDSLDLIVSNPPYIEATDPHLEEGDVAFEPHLALVAQENGLQAIRQIAKEAYEKLVPEGLLAVEHGYNQMPEVQEIFKLAGFSSVESIKDFGGQWRVTLCYKGEATSSLDSAQGVQKKQKSSSH